MTAHGDNARPEPREPRPDFSMNRQFLRLPKVSRPLRIGIVCSDGKIPRYARQIVADIKACNFARVTCVISWPAATKSPPSPRRSLLYWLYDRLLARMEKEGVRSLSDVVGSHPQPSTLNPQP